MIHINVLSLFDGISCGRIALERAGIKIDTYYASEIDKYAIQITQKNYPDTIQLGDITLLNENELKKLPKLDLLIGGSPCQGFSFAGKQLNFNDPRSKLFFEYIKIKEWLQKYNNSELIFLLENVKMKKEYQNVINTYLKAEPIEINSALVSAQNRKRLYWTNVQGISQPKDKELLLKDIILKDVEPIMFSNIYGGFKEKIPRIHENKSITIRTASGGGHIPSLLLSEKAKKYMDRLRNGKAACLTANMFKGVPYGVIKELMRRLHPIECERLQTLPDNYTEGISSTQRYKAIGNGWTVDVIAHILSYITSQDKNTILSDDNNNKNNK